jgi:hypothetical protein
VIKPRDLILTSVAVAVAALLALLINALWG